MRGGWPTLAAKLGLNRVQVRNLVLRAVRNQEKLTLKYLTRLKKETIEKESMGRLEFIESRRTLDDVAGHAEAKRRPARTPSSSGTMWPTPSPWATSSPAASAPARRGSWECFAGECGIPMVELKNFREKWVGATEGNLEKIFTILHALGQVMVFVDEADRPPAAAAAARGTRGCRAAPRRMLAKEMAGHGRNRARSSIFATSRPDMVEVDLKRQGRLDVHIPLFPPVDAADKRELFVAMARKLRLDLQPEDCPSSPPTSR